MRIKIGASGDFKKVIGELSIVELTEGATLEDLISELGKKTGTTREGFIGPYKAGAADLVVLVNARSMNTLKKPVKLKDGDMITFLTPFAGG